MVSYLHFQSIIVRMEFYLFVALKVFWKAEDPRVNSEKRFAHYEIYMLTLCLSYHYEKFDP